MDRKDILTQPITRMNPEDIVLSEVSQSQVGEYSITHAVPARINFPVTQSREKGGCPGLGGGKRKPVCLGIESQF